MFALGNATIHGPRRDAIDSASTAVGESIASAACLPSWDDNCVEACKQECQQQSILLRHLVDNPFRRRLLYAWHEPTLFDQLASNPFRPYPAPGKWPGAITILAEAASSGQDCIFALHDALEESGFADLAEHFSEPDHPKGCWGLDLILGRE